MRAFLLILTLLLMPTAGLAQAPLRALPAGVKYAVTGQAMALPMVELNGKPRRLAPGATIIDANNRSLVQGALPSGVKVAYVLDMNGDIRRIYILTDAELSGFKP